jgi:hypothetical protein
MLEFSQETALELAYGTEIDQDLTIEDEYESNEDKLKVIKSIRFESFYGGDTVIMSLSEAKDEFGCIIEALQGYCSHGAVFALDEEGNDIFINWN